MSNRYQFMHELIEFPLEGDGRINYDTISSINCGGLARLECQRFMKIDENHDRVENKMKVCWK